MIRRFLESWGFIVSAEQKQREAQVLDAFRATMDERDREHRERIRVLNELARTHRWFVYKDGVEIAVGRNYDQHGDALTIYHDDQTHTVFARGAWDSVSQEPRA